MTSRERVLMALNHQEPDRVPKDLGSSVVAGIHCETLHKLRAKLGLEERIIKMADPTLMLGYVDDDIRQALGLDIVCLYNYHSPFGYNNDTWKEWTLPRGLKVLVGEGFNTVTGDDGYIYAYPEGGNIAKAPSMRMPIDGYYFDNIDRQKNLEAHEFNAKNDYARDFTLLSDAACKYLERESSRLRNDTDCAVFGSLFPGCFGDFFLIPAPWLDKPEGVRNPEDWMMAHFTEPNYIKECFAMQLEVGLKNLERYAQAVQDRIDIIGINGTDFGMQKSLMISPDTYREFYKPIHKQINDWVHKHTNWKTFNHTCGFIEPLIEDFIEAGFDILNPVQLSAEGMDASALKEKYGSRIAFWGAGANPQSTMARGTPEQVLAETSKNVEILSKGGGLILGNVHCIQYGTPPENIIALFSAC